MTTMSIPEPLGQLIELVQAEDNDSSICPGWSYYLLTETDAAKRRYPNAVPLSTQLGVPFGECMKSLDGQHVDINEKIDTSHCHCLMPKKSKMWFVCMSKKDKHNLTI